MRRPWTLEQYNQHMAKFKPKAEVKVKGMSEKAFQEEIRKMALIHGWRYYHPWLSVKSTGGYPDCTLIHAAKKRLIFAELKAEGKKLRPDQQEWIDDLWDLSSYGVSIEVYVWTPSQIDQIWEVLGR